MRTKTKRTPSPALPAGKQWFTVNELAELLCVHRDTVIAWANDGLLTFYRAGDRLYRFNREDVQSFLIARRQTASA